MDQLLFLIESGRPLEMVKSHLAERARVRAENLAMCQQLGVTRASTDRLTGALHGVVFDAGAVPADWKKPTSKGVSFPKKGSEWERRLKAQTGYADPSELIAEAFNIPTHIDYTKPGEDTGGWRMIGLPLRSCGFLWVSESGPFAMWIPDVPGEVRKSNDDGFEVAEPAKSFKPVIDGCRQILEEEWDLIVAKHKLASRQAELAQAA